MNSRPAFSLTTLAIYLALAAQAAEVTISRRTFDSLAQFTKDWNYNYPWGDVHNGGARMSKSNVDVSDGTLTLTARRVTGQPPVKTGTRALPINYVSGTVYAKQHFRVLKGGGFDFASDVRATTTAGTWPALWLSAVDSWPPEIDWAEWKGSGKVFFNTFNTPSQFASDNVPYRDPEKFHNVRAELRDENGMDVSLKFYLDGRLVTTQVGHGFVGKAFYL